jgi:hypothetical protein
MNMLKRQNEKIDSQTRQVATLQAELHQRDAPKLSSSIKNAGVRAHVVPLEQSKATFQEIGASLAAHATGEEILSPATAELLKSKCDGGKLLIEKRLQYHKDCDKLGFDVAKELLAMRKMGERDAAALALENRAKKAVESKRKAQSEAAGRNRRRPKSSNRRDLLLSRLLLSFGSLPRSLRSFLPQFFLSLLLLVDLSIVVSVSLDTSQKFSGYQQPQVTAGSGFVPPGYSGFQPQIPGLMGPPPRPTAFAGMCFGCQQFGHRSSKCPNLAGSAANAGRSIQ